MKKIVFDFDGVIVDTREMAFEIFRQIHPEITMKNFLDCFDTGVSNDDGIGIGSGDEFIKHFFNEYDKQLGARYLYDDAENALRDLSKKAELFMITGNSEKVVKDFCQKNNIDVFRDVLGYEASPLKTEKFKILQEKYSIQPEEIIFVTDTLGDVREGREAGCQILAETFGYHDRERLQRGNPDWLVDSWGEVVEILG